MIELVLRKIFTWIPTHQEPILALDYPWYTNLEHNRRKDKISVFVIDWLIDFCGMPTYPGLLYAQRLDNYVKLQVHISIFCEGFS